ncbi:ABC transporter permease [Marinoscillum sp. MHG1-6]|uniref:ABC transporter permease n=1 Tax=Marinoscillum sp. MHG1-6 TaxID=2959627 RepID=UPI0021589944|nr:ABC transporter permease [Marinoscillum sp. MHG1-6]
MFDRDRWEEIFQTIAKNRLRTFLSGFTVALGIFIFVILFGLGNGLKNTFQEFFLDDATNIIRLYPGNTSKPYKGYKTGRNIQFTNEDVEAIEKAFPQYVDYLTVRIYRNGEVRYGTHSNSYSVRGTSPEHLFAENTIIMKGRYLNYSDIANAEKHAVIGRLVEKDLFEEEDAIGKYIRIRGSTFKVIGVFQDQAGDNEERNIYAPYSTVQLLDGGHEYVDQIIVAFKPTLSYGTVLMFAEELNKYMRERLIIHPDDNGGIYLRNVAKDYQQNQQFATVLQIIVSFVGLGTLIAGIIGISNIMVFVIKERTKELGIRKALGATPSSIIGMVLQESILITIVSGYLGLMAGVGVLSWVGDTLKPYFIRNPEIDLGTALGATIILIICGGIAGYIPARRAAKIKPIVALRDE